MQCGGEWAYLGRGLVSQGTPEWPVHLGNQIDSCNSRISVNEVGSSHSIQVHTLKDAGVIIGPNLG
jgi:hypothetical protein